MGRSERRAFKHYTLTVTLVGAFIASLGTISLAAGSTGVSIPTRQAVSPAPETTDVILLPGSFEAEDYRAGGEGVGYHDTTPENIGGVYRDDAVDIQANWNGDDGYHVAWIDDGEWLAYDVEFEASGRYVFAARVATVDLCHLVQGVRIKLDDVDVSGEMRIPNTGGWQRWETVRSRPVNVEAGSYTLTIEARTGGFNLDRIDVHHVTPGLDAPVSLPGRIQAEDYRGGGQGVGYHDTTEGNACGAYRTDDVDIQVAYDATDGYNVGWIEAGEWLAYNVLVPAGGQYVFTFRVATVRNEQSLHVLLDDVNVTGSVEIPRTGGWQAYIDVSSQPVEIAAGSYILKVVAESKGYNLNYIDVTAAEPAISPYMSPPGGDQTGAHDTTIRSRISAPMR